MSGSARLIGKKNLPVLNNSGGVASICSEPWFNIMKHILALLALFSVFTFLAPSATAYDGCARRVVSYTSCGRPIYAHYEVYGYDRCGSAVGRWVTDWYRCSCAVCNPRPVYSYPSYGGGYSTGGDTHHRHSCDYPQRRSGFYFSFGR